MRRKRKRRKNNSRQCVIFLIQENEGKVFIDIGCSAEPKAVLRKHWRGDDPVTKGVFSRENPEAKPVMWLWDTGCLTRSEAKVFAMEWERLFVAEGYEIVGSKISHDFQQSPPKFSECEMERLQKASVSGLLNGEIGYRIECGSENEGRRSPYQRYTAAPADETLRVQVKGETADNFKSFCRKQGLSHGQGLELLLANYTGNYDAVVLDLQERLRKADSLVEESKQKILNLWETVKELEANRNYPKKYRMAELQNLLLKDFFENLPPMKECSGKELKEYAYGEGVLAFPQGSQYSYPAEEGNVHICVEHIRISKGHPSCKFIYGKDDSGNKIKIRWYPVKGNRFGISVSNSPFWRENAPWIFSVQEEGEVMEMVGSLPDLRKLWEIQNNRMAENDDEIAECAETEADDDRLQMLLGKSQYDELCGWIKEDEELTQIYERGESEEKDSSLMEEIERNVLLSKDSSLDDKINAARKNNGPKNKRFL